MRLLKKLFTSRENDFSLLNPRIRYQLLATLIVNIITFSHGVGTGWLSPILTKLQSTNSPLSFEVTVDEISWLGSMLGLGGVFGNIIMGILISRISRKLCIYLIAFPNAIIWILIYCATNVEYLYVARFLCGFTSGCGYIVVPIFISEIADPKIRGALSSLILLLVNVGMLVGFILGTHLNYHVIPFVAVLLPIAYFIASLFLPETTQHLMRCGKMQAAEDSFIFYRNLKNDEIIQYQQDFDELRNIVTNQQKADAQKLSYRDFLNKPALKAFGCTLVLSAGYEFCNVFSFVNYTSEVFAASGSVLDRDTSTIVIGIVQIIGVYTSTLLVDIWGRRILMLLSMSGITIGCVAFAIFTHFAEHHDLSSHNWLPLAIMIFIIYIADIGLVALFLLVIIEAFPVKIRSVGTTISLIMMNAFVFVSLKLFPLLLHYYGISNTMWWSALISLLTFIYFLFFLPETKGKSMDVDE